MPLFSLDAFRRVCNLRLLALVFYFCFAHAASRSLSWYGIESRSLEDTVFDLARLTRQALLSGVSILLFVGLAEGLMAHRKLSFKASLLLQGLAVALGAALGAMARFAVASLDKPDLSLRPAWYLSTILGWSIFGGMAYALLRQLRAARETQAQLRSLASEREALRERETEAQISALNAQIEPHFLFNTLANVKRLHETHPERGRDMLTRLIAYLRVALPGMRASESTLATELELVRHYLAILQMRMGERLSFSIDAAPGLLQAALPPMVLPTLVENAIKHGLAPLPEGGRIEIEARREGAHWQVEVRDNGQGFAPSSSGTGLGLANTRARLSALFGAAASLELESGAPRGVTARLRLPMSDIKAAA